MIRLFFALLILISFGCHSKEVVTGPKIFGSLYVRYLQDGNQLKAEASFFEGDSAHLATPKSILGGVSFQGSGMERRNIQDKLIRYQYETKCDYPGQFTFQVQDDQGQAHQFQLDMLPVTAFSLPDTIQRGKEAMLEILPAPQSDEVEMAILWTDESGKASLLEFPAPISKTIPISPAQLARFAPGKYQIYLVKKRKNFINTGVYRNSCEVEFYTGVKEVFIN
ncbi:MAG: hypothetical protein H6563_01855 [Lewinellaceae bacterium]|nr:hypothetical protein [Lewinellaceae bacterium]